MKYNRNQFALDNLKYNIFLVDNDKRKQLEEHINILQELVNRNRFTKVDWGTDEIGDREAFGGTGYLQYATATCPNPMCQEELNVDEQPSYCKSCGQALDWSVDDDEYYEEDR